MSSKKDNLRGALFVLQNLLSVNWVRVLYAVVSCKTSKSHPKYLWLLVGKMRTVQYERITTLLMEGDELERLKETYFKKGSEA